MRCGLVGVAVAMLLVAISLEHVDAQGPPQVAPENTVSEMPPPPSMDDFDLVEANVHDDPLVKTFDGATIFLPKPGLLRLCGFPLVIQLPFDPCQFNILLMVISTPPPNPSLWIYGFQLTFGGQTYYVYQQGMWITGGVGWIPFNCIPWTVIHFKPTFPNLFIFWDWNCCLVFASTDCRYMFRWCPRTYWFSVALSRDYMNQVTGIFGNFNGIEDDDYKTSDEQDVAGEPDRYVRIFNSYLEQGTMRPPNVTETPPTRGTQLPTKVDHPVE